MISSKITTDLLRIETRGRVIMAIAIKVKVVPGMIQKSINSKILTVKSTETIKAAAIKDPRISNTRVEEAIKVISEVAQAIRSMMTG